ncbi:MAG: DUF177 domain-containing protein [Chloroflexota bacterium]|nr:DUF177 domain-containing protein [Chloroflexia bacterium]MDQ3167552.1 DUF177 domain-containing protein [Chloroflexota bacterium]MDQ3513209.1 DUF177 domain-containing protein [Chloroflexota bacterium]
MGRGRPESQDLVNESTINVAGLLQDAVGGKREYGIRLDAFALADDLQAARLGGIVRLTRLSDVILASVRLEGQVHMECVRCLRTYVEAIRTRFEEEYRPTVDVRTGGHVHVDRTEEETDELFEINELHELDLGEAIRQHVILSLPMRPDCGEDCPGPAPLARDESEIDERLARLGALLDGDEAAEVAAWRP